MRERLASPAWLLEVFVATNFLVLACDIVLAHSVNDFAHPAEWIPLVFSVFAGAVVLVGCRDPHPNRGRPGRAAGEVVGWVAVAVGITGLLWHLSSDFFQQVTLTSLVYSAPFVAPLAFAGLGLLLLMNRRTDAGDPSWSRWVIFLAWCGIVGNFGLSLADHARNGFFDPREWVAVAGAAAGVGGVLVAVVWPLSRPARRVAWVALVLQVAVGVTGFLLHAMPLLGRGDSVTLFEGIVFGPPALAPLLFANLALPGALGLWALEREGFFPISSGKP